ncbi:MAG: bifunctional enoyl-CoA hydratase/phosphate acetyltransferase [Bacillota bacterium]|uniref:Phosphate butyryltransferase n=2 Tax=Carboxydocella TaxID=178898 RepID=A0A1T4NJ36_9FIRM|nr:MULTISPECIES: bifunctional enoyl-CoA hydratase/phosphate acetyltransferase [Carboxydocella]AVX20062.1 phosphate butyryltransferase [Carboxydocella thermautotrophica]AVX30479.1 phosphate butyryltransferase [Carboxydocella thermautotrophica]SJZ79143.1 phosphate butyryltransferase [Carboxydocella sporoproducens DSM 16521]GAW27862.1 phosphate butyryltransferase [Carboxydocella sp. ULO1]GAW32683.1 phosphate butyryltransferase [Carboxydocella sp. JDF658]
MITNFDQLVETARSYPSQRLAVAVAQDCEVLAAVREAIEENLITARLFGDEEEIKKAAVKAGLDLNRAEIEVIHERDPVKASQMAVVAVKTGQADMLMKGLVHSAVIMKQILDKDTGLRKSKVLSHVALLEGPGPDRITFMTDGGMVINPNLQQKVEMINNAVGVARALGYQQPKVAVIAGLELVNPDMPATLDAAVLAKMGERGQIPHAIVDGPLALDVALSREAALHKGVKGEIQGDAHILLVPNLEVGNVLYKTAVAFGGVKTAGTITGASAPIILTSRADSHYAKFYSIALAQVLAWQNQRR